MVTTKFIEKVQETPTDWSFRFEKPVGYEYKAGQYSVMRMPMMFPDTRHGARTCSLSSSPTEDFLQFTFTIRDTGFKQTIMEMQPGDEASISPARGPLTLDEVKTDHLCMVAGGIGVAPFRAIAKFMQDKGLTNPKTTLFYSDKDHHEIVFAKEWQSFQNLVCNITLTRLGEEHTWDGLRGRLQWEMFEAAETIGDDVTYMLCGAPEMVIDVRAMLEAHGVNPERIIQELFTGY